MRTLLKFSFQKVHVQSFINIQYLMQKIATISKSNLIDWRSPPGRMNEWMYSNTELSYLNS